MDGHGSSNGLLSSKVKYIVRSVKSVKCCKSASSKTDSITHSRSSLHCPHCPGLANTAKMVTFRGTEALLAVGPHANVKQTSKHHNFGTTAKHIKTSNKIRTCKITQNEAVGCREGGEWKVAESKRRKINARVR